MKPAPFTYQCPNSIPETIKLLQQTENAKILAGGQSLIPMLNLRYAIPDCLIDVSRIPDLTQITVSEGHVTLGAMVRQAVALADSRIAESLPCLTTALSHVGHLQTRSRGTVGGSLCHLDPAAELPLIALVYNARLVVEGPDGTRMIAAADWAMGYMMPALAPDEILVSVQFPRPHRAEGWGFSEFARRHGDFAIASAAVRLTVASGYIQKVIIGVGGLMEVPSRLTQLEESLIGLPADLDSDTFLTDTLAKCDVMEDAYYPAAFRRSVGAQLIKRALVSAFDRSESPA
ncbi:xanthine dehydrogenase family protein subunit M [Puniceibacterium sp. IMCC21224]|uniref:FAD binding domain-containing protein n=1 Tax=Puniceibacterium sp. IMCC21224 TaxID=1618204 RepID=UPI00064DABA3|nr:FAD binding domain-containing protein [Puniceibacterium sp. IMCC21224]KMK64543.1 aerobic-type carbon monoxide dehydrogenase, middle subunit CoxM/CutM-like protein [Puniceibacterium sp. IMCC21224]